MIRRRRRRRRRCIMHCRLWFWVGIAMRAFLMCFFVTTCYIPLERPFPLPATRPRRPCLWCRPPRTTVSTWSAKPRTFDYRRRSSKTSCCSTSTVSIGFNWTCSHYTTPQLDEPVVNLQLVANEGIVRENDVIRFECNADGRPASFEYQWSFNDQPMKVEHGSMHSLCNQETLTHSLSGIVSNGSNLIINGVRKEDKGRYRCHVSNLIGRSDSNQVQLHIHCNYFFIVSHLS